MKVASRSLVFICISPGVFHREYPPVQRAAHCIELNGPAQTGAFVDGLGAPLTSFVWICSTLEEPPGPEVNLLQGTG